MTDQPAGKPDAPKPAPSPADKKADASPALRPPAKTTPPSPRDSTPGKPPVRGPVGKASESPAPKAARPEKAEAPGRVRKPFPWPLLLALAVPLGVGGLLAWLWRQEDLYTLGRTGWICLSVVLPGFGVMTILGGVAQVRRRPILSTLALLLGIATVLACVYGFRIVTEANWLD